MTDFVKSADAPSGELLIQWADHDLVIDDGDTVSPENADQENDYLEHPHLSVKTAEPSKPPAPAPSKPGKSPENPTPGGDE